MTTATSTRIFISTIIEKYKRSPCLWQVTHDDYHDKYKKTQALKELLVLFKAHDKDANLDTVRRKISSIRNSFKKERNKVKASMKAGADPDEVHVPKLWYYNKLLFLVDNDSNAPEPSESIEYLEILENKIPFEDEDNPENSDEDDETEAQSPSPSSSMCSRRSSNPKRTKNQTHALLSKICKKIESPSSAPPKMKYTAYGEHIAEKLRSMSPHMATYCQKIINDAIFMAETNNLDINSHIVTDK